MHTIKLEVFFNSYYKLTGNVAQDVVNVALAQKGKNRSQMGYSYDWCSAFVCDCASLAGITNIAFEKVNSALFRQLTKSGYEGHRIL